jgi:hypothetical protein
VIVSREIVLIAASSRYNGDAGRQHLGRQEKLGRMAGGGRSGRGRAVLLRPATPGDATAAWARTVAGGAAARERGAALRPRRAAGRCCLAASAGDAIKKRMRCM